MGCMLLKKVCTLVVGLLALPGMGIAQSALELFERVDPSSELALLANDPDRFEKNGIASLRRLARGSEAITPEIIEQNRIVRVEWRIADRLQFVSTLDLNEDGQVDFEEGELAAEYRPHLASRHQKLLQVIDTNSDELLSRDEILTYATNYANAYPELPRETGEYLLRFDLDGDQTVNAAEIQSYVQTVRTLLESQPGQEEVCILPSQDIVPSYKLYVINNSDQFDENGQPVVVVSKENGAPARPLLFLSKIPVVIKFEGDPSLATTLIVTDDVIDVVGLPAEKVIRVPKSPCTTYSGEDRLSHTAYLNRGRITHALGHMKNNRYKDVQSIIYW